MDDKQKKHFSDKFLRRVFIALFVMLILVIIGITIRIVEYRKLRNTTNQQAILTVATIKAAAGPATEEIVLPGNVQAWHGTTIYARTNGYTVNWKVDIGSHVKAGELLAEIASPEVDAQLRQTEADLKTAEANYQLAKTTAARWKVLLKTNSVSKQENDEKVSNEKATAAIVVSTRANRDRLRELVSFERVVAPFEGIISSRTTDIGRLINAGSGGTLPLFRIVQVDPLYIYVRVPQAYSSSIQPNMTVDLYFAEHPGKTYPAKLLNTAQAIDYTTRTLLAQFTVNNPNYELLAGGYTEVHLKLPGNPKSVILPVNTLIFRAHNMQVATITKDNTALLKGITIGRDYGDTVEVVAGVSPGETIILNPPDAMITGQKVRVVTSAYEEKEPK